ncbi:hypothetical protein FKM82_017244, partial [Ascaphus truei]
MYSFVYRLLNALLPSLRRQYLTLSQAGLADAAIESDFKEIEHLVQKEKVVVWADQTITKDSNTNDIPEIAAIVAFPHLKCNQTTPCGAEKWQQRIQLGEKQPQNESTLAVVQPFVGEP